MFTATPPSSTGPQPNQPSDGNPPQSADNVDAWNEAELEDDVAVIHAIACDRVEASRSNEEPPANNKNLTSSEREDGYIKSLASKTVATPRSRTRGVA